MTTSTAALVTPDEETWRSTLETCQHDLYHLPAYARLDATTGAGRPRAFVYQEGEKALLLPLVVQDIPGEEYQDAVSPYGYSGPVSNVAIEQGDFWARAAVALTSTLRENGIIAAFVRLHPLLPVPHNALATVGTLVKHGDTVVIDADLPPETVWSRTRQSHRRAITQARQTGMQVHINDWGHLDDFIQTYRQTMVRLGAAECYLFDADYFWRLRRDLGDHVHLAAAVMSGEFVGGLLFFHYRGAAHAHLSCTIEDPVARGSSKLLDDEVRRWVQQREGLTYHLGGGVGGKNDSLYEYKRGFSPHSCPFYTWRIVADRAAYVAVSERSGASGSDAGSGYFPAYRAL